MLTTATDVPLLSINSDMYSFHTCESKEQSSSSRTIFNIIKSFLGSGALTLPLAFKEAGYIGALILFPAAFVICLYCMMLLLECRLKRPLCPTYCDLVRNAFGETGFAIANIALVSFQVCCTIAYIVLASHNLSLVYSKLSQQEWCYILMAPIGLLCLLKSPKGLAPFSLLANLSLLCVIVFVSWFSGSELLNNGISSEVVAFKSDTFLSSIGIFIFSFEGVTLVLPLFNTMQGQHRFKPIFATTLSILCTIYVFYALGAYFALEIPLMGSLPS
ncbi:hypothetical protein GEMRC1_002823 [Eukaryota sp. GEM-RC1]